MVYTTGFKEYGTYLLSQGQAQVPSAIRGLTTLFGMGRGEHPWKKHHKIIIRSAVVSGQLEQTNTTGLRLTANNVILGVVNAEVFKKLKLTGN